MRFRVARQAELLDDVVSSTSVRFAGTFLTTIIGIITDTAILQMSEYVELEHGMPLRQMLLEVVRNRFRPIGMTTLAATLALAIGAGAGMHQLLAIAIVPGLIVGFPLVLLAMPVMIGLTLKR